MAKTEKNEIVTMSDIDNVSAGLFSQKCKETWQMLQEYKEDGDASRFAPREVQENVYELFVMGDMMGRIAEAIKENVGNLVIDTAHVEYDADGEIIKEDASLYGFKMKNNGSQTKILGAYELMKKLANDCGADLETMLSNAEISIKKLSAACGLNELYIKQKYGEHVQVTPKKKSVIREF